MAVSVRCGWRVSLPGGGKLVFPLALAAAAIASPGRTQNPSVAAPDYQREVRPILSEHCFACHGPDEEDRRAKLRLDTAEGQRRVVVPGSAGDSELVRRVTHPDPEERMPPASRRDELTAVEIDTLKRWVAAGAEFRGHWSTSAPPRRAQPPQSAGDAIDRWLDRGIRAAGLQPTRRAESATLVRRLALDLTGLPPSRAQIDRFIQAPTAANYSRLVDELLGSPHHGERMAAYWLDLVRYADTVGYHGDQEHASGPYRDWVIQAFRDNMPFDQFTIEQLAGDLLRDATEQQRVASGYNRLLQTTHEGGAQAKEYLAIYSADRVRNFGSVWLGQTTGCAQCHDHKYDPIRQRDFYQLAAFFADVTEKGDFKGSPNSSPTTRPPEISLFSPPQRKWLQRVDSDLRKLGADPAARRPPKGESADVQSLRRERAELLRSVRKAMVTYANPNPRETRLLRRGDWMDESGPIVEPKPPAYLPAYRPSTSDDSGTTPPATALAETAARRWTRLDLARWLMQPDHPLTARVFANRVWYLLFGRGLSTPLDDLGAQGSAPDYPELLDELAVSFRDSDWDVRALIRRIVHTRAYQRSSIPSEQALRRDPDNRWFARQGRWRLPAEFLRDNALEIAGLLDRAVGGPSARPYQPPGYYRHLNFPPRRYRQHEDRRQWRRGVYMHWQRLFLHPTLKALDAPTREECTAERPRSNTPLAALTLLNDPSFVEAARSLAVRMFRHGSDSSQRVRFGFELATGRSPSAAEADALIRLYSTELQRYRDRPSTVGKLLVDVLPGTNTGASVRAWPVEHRAAWAALFSVARALINLHETSTRN